jgi:hypothetical protein
MYRPMKIITQQRCPGIHHAPDLFQCLHIDVPCPAFVIGADIKREDIAN